MKKVLSLVLALLMVLSLLPVAVFAAEAQYDDIDGHWAKSSIERWSEYKIVEGSGGHFRPDASLTRGEMAKILASTLGLTEQGAENPFTDVAADAWYAPYVLRCYAAGIMKGDGANAKPTASITRQEAMVMLCRALAIAEKTEADLSAYGDAADVADWAKGAVAALTEGKIVNGVDGSLVPERDIDRASIMAILDRAIVQYINAPGSYTLTDKDGIVLVAAAGDVTLTGKTPADVLVTPAAKGKTVAFDKAEVTGAITVQADGAKVTKKDSKLPEIVTAGKNITVEDAKAEAAAGGGGGGGNSGSSSRTPSVSLKANADLQDGKLTVGSKLTATVSNAGGAKLVWSVGGFDLEQETSATEYTVTAADLGKVIFAKLVKEDGTVAASSQKFTVAATAEVDVTDETAPVQIDLGNTTFYKEATDAEGNVTKEEVTVSENDKLVLSVAAKTDVTDAEVTAAKTDVKETAETSVLAAMKVEDATLESLTEDQKTELAAATEVKAVDVDLTLVTTTTTTDPGEGEEPTVTTTETPVHPVGETKVILSAAQLGLAGEDLNLYHFVAGHTNVDKEKQAVVGVVDKKGETVTFTTNGLSTIWVGNVPPRTVTFNTGAGGTKVDSQKVRFGGKVNTTKLPEKIERAGYLFCGWGYDLAKTPIITNLEVTAKWVVGTMMPTSRYQYKNSMSDQNFTFKEEDGRITVTADPEVTYGADISITPTVTAYDGAVKYYVSADAATAAAMTDAEQFAAVAAEAEITLSPAVTVTDAQGAVKGGKTSYFVKWLDKNNAVLALEELTVVIDDGKGATDTKIVTRDINRGVGTFEPYMTSSAKPDAPKWVGYINANPERRYNNDGEREYYLNTSFGFEQNFSWPDNVTSNDYDVLHVDFTPFTGESYTGKDVSAEVEYNSGNNWTTISAQCAVTQEGKLAVTVPVSNLTGSKNDWSIDIGLFITVGSVTQGINGWFRNPNYVEHTYENVHVADMDELRAKLAEAAGGAKELTVTYDGAEDVTLTDALTIPWTANVYFNNCSFTVGKGGVLTLESGAGDSADLTLRENSFTVADGGKVVTVDKRPAQNDGSIVWGGIDANHITVARGGQIEVQAGTVLCFEPYYGSSSSSKTCVLEAGSVVKVNAGHFDIRNFDKATLAGQISGVRRSYMEFSNDENELSGTISLNGQGDGWEWSSAAFYGDTTITGTGKVEMSGRGTALELHGSMTNRGTIALSGNAYGIFTNTGYAQHNEGTITIGSGSYIECQGTKLVNTGTISGAGELIMNLGNDTTDYGDRFTGVEYVDVAYEDSSPSNYSRYKFVRDPAATVEVTLYKAELVNEQGGTCTAQTNTEEFPES